MPDSWGSFMNKPTRGWLHPDNVITRSSVCYDVHVKFYDNFINLCCNCLVVHKIVLMLFTLLVYWAFESSYVNEEFGL